MDRGSIFTLTSASIITVTNTLYRHQMRIETWIVLDYSKIVLKLIFSELSNRLHRTALECALTKTAIQE